MTFRFDRFVVDPREYRLEENGRPQSIEPRVFDLLHYLIEHRDRVVSRDELLEEVWSGQIVGDAALTRSVYEARRALGDDAQQQRYIRTVHGRGLQFVGEITSEGDGHEPPEGGERRGTRSYGVALGLAALLLLGLVALVALGRSRPSGTASSEVVRLGMLPWTEDGSDSDFQLLELGLTDYIATRLGATSDWVVRPVDQVRRSLATQPSLERVAEVEALSHLLGGQLSIAEPGDRAILDLVLYSVGDTGIDHQLPVGRYELPLLTDDSRLVEFNRIRESVSRDLVEQIRPALDPVDDRGLSTGELAAYRLVVRGRERLAAQPCDGGGALALAQQATQIDPEFALAWGLVAVAHYNQVWCGGDMRMLDLAMAATQRVRELSPALADKAVAAEGTWKVEAGRLEEAWEAVREGDDARAGDPDLLYARAYVLRYAGYLEEGEQRLQELLAIDPLFLSRAPQAESPNLLLYQNRFDDFLALLPATESAYHRYYQALVALLTGHTERAREIAAPCFRDDPASIYGRFCHALSTILDGDPERAVAICRQLESQRADLGHTDGEATYKLAQLLVLAGEAEAGLEQLRLAVDQGFVATPYFRIDPIFQSLRETAAYRGALDAAEVRHRAFGERFGLSQRAP